MRVQGQTLKVVFVAVLVGVGLRVVFLLLAPLEGEAVEGKLSAYNDERAHFNYITYLLTHHRLPGSGGSIRDNAIGAEAAFENYQPPLYYLLCAPPVALWQTAGWPRSYLAARMISLLAGMALLPLMFSIALAFGLDRSAAAGAVIVVSVLGSFVRFSALVSNDTLCWLFSGLAIYFWLRVERGSSARLNLLFWCLSMVAGLFTKFSILLLLPLPMLYSLVRRNWRQSLKWFVWTIIVVFAALPIWIRNAQIFGSIVPLSAGFGIPGTESGQVLSVLAYAVRSFLFPWQEFWSGWPGSLLLVSIILAISYLTISSAEQLRKLREPVLFCLLVLAGIGGFAWLNLHYFQAEGRYLLGVWPVWVIMIGVAGKDVIRQWILFAALLFPYLLFMIPFGELARV